MKSRIATSAFFGTIFAFLFLASMGRNLNHDEHQFIAPAAILAEHGLQPYRDYPLFHLPNLVFLYARLFRLFEHPFLTARCFSIFCAFATAVLIFRVFRDSSSLSQTGWRSAASFAPAILFLFNPLALFTTGRAWNHDSTALFTVLATILQVNAARRDSIPHAAASAIYAGLAAGIRLTAAPILIPLWISIWFFPTTIVRRVLIGSVY